MTPRKAEAGSGPQPAEGQVCTRRLAGEDAPGQGAPGKLLSAGSLWVAEWVGSPSCFVFLRDFNRIPSLAL